MKFTGLIIAGIVLAALTGTLYWSNHHKTEETTKVSADTPPKILSLKEADITSVDVRKQGKDQLQLARDKSGKWEITAPKPLRADPTNVAGMLSNLTALNADRLVEQKASDLGQYGLANPSAEILVSEKGNKTQKLLIGDDTPTQNGAYAMLQGDPRVFTIGSYVKTSLEKSPNDVRDTRLLTVDADKVSQVELIAKKQDIEFGRNKDDWQILKPRPLRANSIKVGDLVRKLTEARMDTSEDEKKADSAFASGSPIATAKLTDEGGTQQIQVRKSKDDYYAKSSVVDGVYKVTSDLGQSLDKGVDDFRNKSVFSFGYTDPNKIEIHDGAKAYFLTKSGDDWWSGEGKKMDVGSVQSLVDKLRDLSASKFVDSGFTTPAMELTVTSKDGKQVEKVQIAKAGDGYIAKRENDSSLYQLEGKDVDQLRDLAKELKPATEEKAKT
jgi:hypothetical protein